MTFFTGKGDKGTSSLFDSTQGTRISKASLVFEALGQVDELNSTIGWCKVACEDFMVLDVPARDVLHEVQDHLFTIQAELAGAGKHIAPTSIKAMGDIVESIEAILPEVKTFLVAGGTELSARLDIARTVARRAERHIVALLESGERPVSEATCTYLNRLSSLLYALIRLENHASGVLEHAPDYS